MSKALAAAPNRTSTSFTLSWGMVSIPCSVYVGIEPTGLARKEFVKDTDHPVGRVQIDKTDGTVIDRADVIKKAEATNGAWVELDDDEIAAVTTERRLASVVGFVPVKNLPEYETEGLLQVRPKRVKGKVDPGGNKALSLLYAALAAEKCAALIHLALRGPARYALLDASGDLRWVVTADAIRQPVELPDASVSDAELDLARKLIKAEGKSVPVLVDDTAATIQAYVDSKAAGQPVVTATEPEQSGADLIQQLMASIAGHKAEGAA